MRNASMARSGTGAMRTSQNAVKAKFGELSLGEVGCIVYVRPLLDGVEASILHLSLVGFALPLCLSHSYDLVPGAPTSGVIPSNNPAHQEIYQTCVMIDPIL